jgi:hypothetical protein
MSEKMHKNEKLLSFYQGREKSNKELITLINTIKSNLNILKNSFKDLKEILNKYEFALDQSNNLLDEDRVEILQNSEMFKEKIEIDSIVSDAKQIFRESNYSLEEIENYINNSEQVSNVELN